jgi:type IV pilus assembly protein PilE
MSRNGLLRNNGFTLIELLVVVAIIGIISTTALSMFRSNKARSMRAEAMTNLAAIAALEKAYYGENGNFPAAPSAPLGAPGEKQNWDAFARTAFGSIGFETEAVFFVYDVNSAFGGTCGCASGGCFTAAAYGDSDKDTFVALVGLFHPDSAGVVCPDSVLGEFPPIDPDDGVPILDQPVDLFVAQFDAGIVPPSVDDF